MFFDEFLYSHIVFFGLYKINYTKDYSYSYSNDDIVASCYYMSDRDWLFVVTDSKVNVFSVISKVRRAMLITMVVVAAITVFISSALLQLMIKPFDEEPGKEEAGR